MTQRFLFFALLFSATQTAFASLPDTGGVTADGDKPTVAQEITDDSQLAGLTVEGTCGDDCMILSGYSDSDKIASRTGHVHVKAAPTHSCHQEGIASTYNTGNITANGEKPHWGAMEAANKTLPFHTRVKVTNKRSGVTVVVRINDRGPYVAGRVIDLTPAAARAIGMGDGLAPVTVECI
jgi:rare lipoprotein A (peptidoglycan hydrolase)